MSRVAKWRTSAGSWVLIVARFTTDWKKRYSGMDSLQLKRLKEFEEENCKLKQMYADMALDNKMLKDVLSKK